MTDISQTPEDGPAWLDHTLQADDHSDTLSGDLFAQELVMKLEKKRGQRASLARVSLVVMICTGVTFAALFAPQTFTQLTEFVGLIGGDDATQVDAAHQGLFALGVSLLALGLARLS